MADYKAISMNLMHEDMRVTDDIYAPLLGNEVRDRISRLNNQGNGAPSRGLELVPNESALSKIQWAAAPRALADQVAG